MMQTSHKKISLRKDGWRRPIETLCWKDDDLVDIKTTTIFSLDGQIKDGGTHWRYRFDNAISFSDKQHYSVMFETFGTKGIVIEGVGMTREINRSFYLANVYEYPVTVFRYLDGRICLAHCPEEYNILEIEDFVTGERLTAKNRESHDFFHSRLEVSSDGNYLLSAGWVWHPVDMVEVYDLTDISNPKWFNLYHDENLNLFEINSATFLDNKTVVLTGNEEEENQKFIYSYDIEEEEVLTKANLPEIAGNLMTINENYVLGFYENPKLINIKTGKIEKKWEEIKSGKQNSSIKNHNDEFPTIAKDIVNKRVAVVDKDFIHVLEFRG
jgi:hypothetical protein